MTRDLMAKLLKLASNLNETTDVISEVFGSCDIVDANLDELIKLIFSVANIDERYTGHDTFYSAIINLAPDQPIEKYYPLADEILAWEYEV